MAFGGGRGGRMQLGAHRGYGVPSNGFQPRVMRNLVKKIALIRPDFLILELLTCYNEFHQRPRWFKDSNPLDQFFGFELSLFI